MHDMDILWASSGAHEGANLMALNDDARFLNGLQKLDPHVIGVVYDRYFADVYRYARYRINDELVAEDLAADVFVRLMEAVQKGRGPQSNIKGWLIATASNAVNDYLRRQYRRPVDDLSESLPDEAENIHSQVDALEQRRHVQQAYARLTIEQQHVLALRFGLGYSLEETAVQLKKSINAVKQLQFRALASLQRALGAGES